MTPQFEYSTVTHAEDLLHLGKILDQCFIDGLGEAEIYLQRIGSENIRILRKDQQVIGGLGILPMGQWWGGQAVRMAGIASVGIAR